MTKIAIFGGAFDPPHFGHVAFITNLYNSGLVDQIVLVPSGDSRYDKRSVASAKHRVTMLKLLIKGSFDKKFPLKIDEIQLSRKFKDALAIDLLDYLSAKHPKNEYYFAVGADITSQLKNWQNYKKLITDYKFIVVPRPGHQLKKIPSKNITYLESEKCFSYDYSSSLIRKTIKSGMKLSGVVPREVLEYALKHGLYA